MPSQTAASSESVGGLIEFYRKQTFFTADVWTQQEKHRIIATMAESYLMPIKPRISESSLVTAHRNGMQPLLQVSFTPVLFLTWRVKICHTESVWPLNVTVGDPLASLRDLAVPHTRAVLRDDISEGKVAIRVRERKSNARGRKAG